MPLSFAGGVIHASAFPRYFRENPHQGATLKKMGKLL
jgi:hypothetical protein